MAHIAIVGGGLSGLTAAVKLSGQHQVTIFEKSDRLGGQIWTERSDGFVIERGAEGFVARSSAVPAIAETAGIADQLIEQSEVTSYGFDGALHALAPGEAARFLGFQVPPDDLGKGIRTFRNGMGSLIDALGRRVGESAAVQLGTVVDGLTSRPGGVRLRVGDRHVDADAVVVATTARAASRVLGPLLGDAGPDEPTTLAFATTLASAATLSSVTVELAYDRGSVPHPLDGTGIVVAEEQRAHGLRACAFTSAKFEGRAPESSAAIRLFFRPEAVDLADLDDLGWQRRAEEAIRLLLGVDDPPRRAWVTRWADALPVFSEAYRSDVAALEDHLLPLHVALAGAAFHGPGIDAAVRSGERAAARWA